MDNPGQEDRIITPVSSVSYSPKCSPVLGIPIIWLWFSISEYQKYDSQFIKICISPSPANSFAANSCLRARSLHSHLFKECQIKSSLVINPFNKQHDIWPNCHSDKLRKQTNNEIQQANTPTWNKTGEKYI